MYSKNNDHKDLGVQCSYILNPRTMADKGRDWPAGPCKTGYSLSYIHPVMVIRVWGLAFRV